MSHVEEQARAREAKKLKRQIIEQLEKERWIKSERANKRVCIDIDPAYLLHLLSEALPEDTEFVERISSNGKGGLEIHAMRRLSNA